MLVQSEWRDGLQRAARNSVQGTSVRDVPTRQRTTAHNPATADDLLKVNFGQGFTFPCLEPMAAAMRLCAATSWSSVVATSHRRACSSIWRL